MYPDVIKPIAPPISARAHGTIPHTTSVSNSARALLPTPLARWPYPRGSGVSAGSPAGLGRVGVLSACCPRVLSPGRLQEAERRPRVRSAPAYATCREEPRGPSGGPPGHSPGARPGSGAPRAGTLSRSGVCNTGRARPQLRRKRRSLANEDRRWGNDRCSV
jgi:hypothetical protein